MLIWSLNQQEQNTNGPLEENLRGLFRVKFRILLYFIVKVVYIVAPRREICQSVAEHSKRAWASSELSIGI